MRKRTCCRRKIKKDYQTKNLKNPFYKKKEKQKKAKSFLLYKIIFLFLILLGLIYFFLVFSFWKITKIEINGTERIRSESVQDLISCQLEKKKLFIFKQDNIFLFRKKIVAENIKEEFNLTDINIKKRLNNKLVVDIKEKPYAFIFAESGEYYFSSADSYIMEAISFEGSGSDTLERGGEAMIRTMSLEEPEPEIEEDVLETCLVSMEEKDKYFIIENKNNNSLVKDSGKISLSKDYLDFIIKLNDKLKQYPEFIIERFIVADQYFNSIFVKLKDGPQIYFNVNTEIKLQIENLLLVKNNKIKDGFNQLEYIDLRYGDTVYFFPENIIK